MPEAAIFQGLSWNPITDLHELVSYPFMVNALEAGTIVAVMAGVTGWFMVLRQQTFAGHTLSIIAFPGAAAASLAALPLAVGYFGFCGIGALALAGIAGTRKSLSAESAAIGSLQALALALGFLFVTLYHGVLNGLDSLLFGTFLGITSRQVAVLLAVAVAALTLLALAARPLIFSSVDPDVASAAGVPVRLLGFGFLLVLGLSVAPCSSRLQRPRIDSPRVQDSGSPSRLRSRSRSPGSGSHSPTSRSTPSASTSHRCRSRSI